MSASNSGTGVQFTPLQGPAAPTPPVLKVIQPEPELSRTYYQDGRLLTAEDLNRDYAYLDRRLLDLGIALGGGIVQGLRASIADGHTIRVTQGRGVAPSGRVIAYSAADPNTTLNADLADLGTQLTFNGAGFSGIGDGLYAAVLLHGEQPSGIAEVFPRDLTTTRVSYETIVDTVEIALVGLTQPIPAGTVFQARAQLAAQFATGQSLPSLSSDSLALGVVAMQKGLPAWFDPALLSHPLRASDDPNATTDDLVRAYAQIYADLMASLAAQGTSTFRAADVFPLLPPRGQLPSAAIDPGAGTQTFFPQQIDVALLPARADEVAALLAQTEGEPAIDLVAGTPAQVLVLVPLAPADYATLAPALLGTVSNSPPPAFKPYPSIALPRIDPLVLRLPGRQPLPPSQPAVWAQIWKLAPGSLPWLVRPTDGGIGGVKAALLAAGFSVPAPPPPTSTSPAVTPTPPPHLTETPPHLTETTPHLTETTPRLTIRETVPPGGGTPRLTETTPHLTETTPRLTIRETVPPGGGTPRLTETTPHLTETTPRLTIRETVPPGGGTPRLTETTPHLTETTPRLTIRETVPPGGGTPHLTETTPRLTIRETVPPGGGTPRLPETTPRLPETPPRLTIRETVPPGGGTPRTNVPR